MKWIKVIIKYDNFNRKAKIIMKKQFFSKFNVKLTISAIIYAVFLILLFIFLYKHKMILACDEESEYPIEYEATVHKLYIINNDVYIVDTDEHVLVFKFDPQLLLLDEGKKILVYINEDQAENNVIYIDNYKQFGFVPKDYNY